MPKVTQLMVKENKEKILQQLKNNPYINPNDIYYHLDLNQDDFNGDFYLSWKYIAELVQQNNSKLEEEDAIHGLILYANHPRHDKDFKNMVRDILDNGSFRF